MDVFEVVSRELSSSVKRDQAKRLASLPERAVNRLRLTMCSTGAAEASFEWFHSVLRGGPVNTGVRWSFATVRDFGKLLPHRIQMRIIPAIFVFTLWTLSTLAGLAQSTTNASTVNKMLEAELLKMEADDQRYRGIIEAEFMKTSSTGTSKASDEFVTAVKNQDEIDSRNMTRLEEIIKQNGWPGKSLVGEEASKA